MSVPSLRPSSSAGLVGRGVVGRRLGRVGDDRAEALALVGEPHPVHAAAVVVVERDHLGELGRAGVRVERGDVGPGGDEVDDRGPVDLLPVGEGLLLEEAEQRRGDDRVDRARRCPP